jgi:predicted small lipoprotein YifL
MKNLVLHSLLLLLVAGLAAGCGSSGDVQATDTAVTAEPPKSPEDEAKQRELLVKMEEVAKRTTATGTWDTLGSADKQPYLDFHKGAEPQAKKHYEEFVLMLRDEGN